MELKYFVVPKWFPVAAKTPEQLQKKKERKEKKATNWSLTASTSARHVSSGAGAPVQSDRDDRTSGSHLGARKRGSGKREEGGGERVNGRLPAAFPFLPDGPIVKPSELN